MSAGDPGRPTREQVLEDFATRERPDAVVDDFVRRFPEFEEHLRALADDLAALLRANAPAALTSEEERFVDRVGRDSDDLFAAVRPGRNVFEGKTPAQIREMSALLDLPLIFIAKLKDGLVDPATIPRRFLAWAADRWKVTEADLRFTFGRPPQMVHVEFKAKARPTAGGQESYAAAIESPALSGEQKERLRAFLD